MNEQELHEAAEILVEELEAWEKPEGGNWIATVAPAGEPGFEYRTKIFYYPGSWGGQKIATDFYTNLLGRSWEEFKDEARDQFKSALKALSDVYTHKAQEGP